MQSLKVCKSEEGFAIPNQTHNQNQSAAAKAKRPSVSTRLLLGLAALCFVLVLALSVGAFFKSRSGEIRNTVIGPDICVAGTAVGGMSEEEALTALAAIVPNDPETTDMTVVFPGKTLVLSPDATKAHWDIAGAVDRALLCTDETANIPVEFSVDESYIRDEISRTLDELGGTYIPSGFGISGPVPDLAADEPVLQELILENGRAGIHLDIQWLMEQILSAYKSGQFHITAATDQDILQPDALDLDVIYRDVYIAPIEPTLDRGRMKATPGISGCDFDLENAKNELAAAAPGSSLHIPCRLIAPQKSDDEVWFLDVLGKCKTPHTDNENRNDNLRLACSKLDGLVLQPGETLSYNDLLGERTAAKGYKPAPAYSGTELVDEIGGGICQVSSTLYLSSLLAELKIVSRMNHGFPVDYIPIGLDATVNWGTTDLKIRNSYDFPIKITAEVTDTDVIVQILGVETRDYIVRIEHRVEGPKYASAYLCHFDKQTGEEIYRVEDHFSLYLDIVWQNPDYADCERIVTYR